MTEAIGRGAAAALGSALWLAWSAAVAFAQQPIPLLPPPGAASGGAGSGGSTIQSTPLDAPPPSAVPPPTIPPPDAAAPASPPADPSPPSAPSAAPASAAAAASRVFCNQEVGYRLADPSSVPQPYRPYLGIFSDAAWTPALCAALIVENVTSDGTATITYVFGPMGSGGKAAGGVLHGTGIVKDGTLLFQNSDGSQYAFKPYYTDLDGHWTAPAGQNYDAIFKKAY
ncbi:MAG: hypothetical protein JO258_00945 [Alphaproteobacteria bacterium]|nr:hypothetical protein [Alphaproteobacteria bacterium]